MSFTLLSSSSPASGLTLVENYLTVFLLPLFSIFPSVSFTELDLLGPDDKLQTYLHPLSVLVLAMSRVSELDVRHSWSDWISARLDCLRDFTEDAFLTGAVGPEF